MAMQAHMQFGSRLAAYGLPIPEAAREAAATWEAANKLRVDDPRGDLHSDALTGALTADNVAERLSEAAAIVSASAEARGLVQALDRPLSQRFATAINAGADRIIEAMAPHFANAAARMAEASPLVPAGYTPEMLLAAGPAVGEAWRAIGDAQVTLDSIREVYRELINAYNVPEPRPFVTAFLEHVDSSEALTRADYLWRGKGIGGQVGSGVAYDLDEIRGGAWRHLIQAGHTLRLNTPAEAARVAALRPAVEDAEVAA